VPLPPVLSSIVTWLRQGYPEGVPNNDYLPLFALLASQLTDAEVAAVADELLDSSDPESARVISEAIKNVTDHVALDSDIARVRAHLAAGGWPLARPH
jgi:hypothetical protein